MVSGVKQFTCGPPGEVVVGAGDPDVGHHGGEAALRAAVCGRTAVRARVQLQCIAGEGLREGPELICEEKRRGYTYQHFFCFLFCVNGETKTIE